MSFQDNTGGCVVCRPAPLFRASTTPPGSDSQGVYLMSDTHIGAPNADYDLMAEELKLAARRRDRVLVNGDVMDLILTKDAKRFSPTALHPRLRGREDLVNAAVDWAEELFSPYANLIDMICLGNHSSTVSKYSSVDPIALLVQRLQAKVTTPGHRVHHGGYTGFVQYRFEKQGFGPFTIFYWHGAGAGSGGLGGALGEFGSKGSFVEGADLLWYGHRHVRAVSQLEKLSCPRRGHSPVLRKQWVVRTGAYLRPYGGQTQESIRKRGRRGNYAADSLCSPYGTGGLRVVLYPDGRSEVCVASS